MTHKKGTILVSDDDDEVRECIRMVLEKQGYRVVTVINGERALTEMDNEIPDLIISDIDMPKLDGYHFSEVVRKNSAWKDIPIIIVSGLTKDSKQSEEVWAHRLGVDAFIGKPFDPFLLAEKVEKLLSRKK